MCNHVPFFNLLCTLEGILCTLAPPKDRLAPGRGHKIIGATSVFKPREQSLLSWEKVELTTICDMIGSSSLTLLWASLVAQLVKNPPAMSETWVWSWVGKMPWRRERLPTPVFRPGEFHGLYSPRGHKEWWLQLHYVLYVLNMIFQYDRKISILVY